jgi:hypothetical protein
MNLHPVGFRKQCGTSRAIDNPIAKRALHDDWNIEPTH